MCCSVQMFGTLSSTEILILRRSQLKYGTVLLFSIAVSGVFSWAASCDMPTEARLEKLFITVPAVLSAVFAYLWYQLKALSDKVEKLEGLHKERPSPTTGADNQSQDRGT